MKDALQPPEAFQNLEIPRKEIEQLSNAQYRVYSDAKNFVLVSAPNAQEAIIASGVANPTKVLRHNLFASNIIDFPAKGTEEVAAAPAALPAEAPATPEAAPAEAAAAPAAEAEATAAPLSNDDVEKLLNN